MEDKRVKILRDDKVSTAVNKMALPAVIGLLVMSIYNIVDTMFVAWIGTDATSATQVILPIMMLGTALGLSIGIGGGSYLSRLIGNNQNEKAETVASVSFYTGVVLSVLFLILSIIFREPLYILFGADETILAITNEYGLYILFGIPLIVLNMVFNNLLRSEGSSKLSMIGLGVGAILNIILDPIFIFVFDMGVSGAAIATTISQAVSFMILGSQYFFGRTVVKIKLSQFRFDLDIYKEIIKIGLPTFFRQLLISVSIAVLNTYSMTYGGSDLLAAIGIVSRVTMLTTNIIFGIGQGFQPVAGYNLGANRNDRVYDAFIYTIKFSTLVSLFTGLVLIIFSEQIFNVFQVTESVMVYGVRGMRLYALGLILLGFTNTASVFYQSVGKGKEAMILSVSRQGYVFLPLIMILPTMFGIDGVLSAQLFADIVTCFITLIIVFPIIQSKNIETVLQTS